MGESGNTVTLRPRSQVWPMKQAGPRNRASGKTLQLAAAIICWNWWLGHIMPIVRKSRPRMKQSKKLCIRRWLYERRWRTTQELTGIGGECWDPSRCVTLIRHATFVTGNSTSHLWFIQKKTFREGTFSLYQLSKIFQVNERWVSEP